MKKHLGIEVLVILSLAIVLYLIGHMVFAPKDLEGWYIIQPSAGIAIVSIFLFIQGLVCDLFKAIFSFNFQNLVCRNHQQEFKFFACRWQGMPLDVYTVYVAL